MILAASSFLEACLPRAPPKHSQRAGSGEWYPPSLILIRVIREFTATVTNFYLSSGVAGAQFQDGKET